MAENDFVQTPEQVVKVLLDNEKFEGHILEPCAGKGIISEVLKQYGYSVTSSDMVDYGYCSRRNLFDIKKCFDNIVTNPPFTLQQKVKKHLLSITKRKLALLWYVKNLGNEVETRTSDHLKIVYVINQKIPWVEVKLGWLFAWYIWDKDYSGDIVIKRVDLF
jgi:methylase of polypeptide subunit release factors